MNTKQIKNKLDKISVKDNLFNQLVPDSGPAETVEGEWIRAAHKIGYRWFNDGDYFFKDYGRETAGGAWSYLLEHSKFWPELEDYLNDGIGLNEKSYTKWVNGLVKMVEKWVKEKIKSGEELTPNNENMLDYSYGDSSLDDYDEYDENDEEGEYYVDEYEGIDM